MVGGLELRRGGVAAGRVQPPVTAATPSILRSAGMTVSTPLMAGQSPGLFSARWICRYSSNPGVTEMIFECGPFQWSIPC
jgi:hypothetical protein